MRGAESLASLARREYSGVLIEDDEFGELYHEPALELSPAAAAEHLALCSRRRAEAIARRLGANEHRRRLRARWYAQWRRSG